MKVYIADILRKAADEFLWDGYPESPLDKEVYSCNAVWWCLINSFTHDNTDLLGSVIMKGLSNIGLDVRSDLEFDEFSSKKERQAARYNWLYFAALIAEEQGAFVEISD